MDYTLSQYKPETFEKLAHDLTVEKLVSVFGYPEVCLPTPLAHTFKHPACLPSAALSIGHEIVGWTKIEHKFAANKFVTDISSNMYAHAHIHAHADAHVHVHVMCAPSCIQIGRWLLWAPPVMSMCMSTSCHLHISHNLA